MGNIANVLLYQILRYFVQQIQQILRLLPSKCSKIVLFLKILIIHWLWSKTPNFQVNLILSNSTKYFFLLIPCYSAYSVNSAMLLITQKIPSPCTVEDIQHDSSKHYSNRVCTESEKAVKITPAAKKQWIHGVKRLSNDGDIHQPAVKMFPNQSTL